MGRQTAIALSEDDEREFLAFLRTGADVKVLRWAAPSPELLFVQEFPPRGTGEYRFRLWNTAFPWNLDLGRGPETAHPQLASQYYPRNTSGAPVLEYSREALDNPKALTHGRIYWNTDFAIYNGPAYDTAEFGHLYDKVVRWLRKRGKRVEITRSWYQYWLPGAWELRGGSAQ